MRKTLPIPVTLAAAFVASATAVAQQPPQQSMAPPQPQAAAARVVEGVDFRVYDRRGRDRSMADLFKAMDDTDALLVGESHDDAVGHGVEAEILSRAAERTGAVGGGSARGRPVVLSLEMFERDVQYILDEYLAGLITEDQFKKSARPWERYDTDYRPMVEFARAHGLPVVAANAPRRYVNRVSRLGPSALDPLPATAKAFLPPLPYPGPSEPYTAKWNALMAEMMAQMRARADSAAGAPPDSASAPPPAAPMPGAVPPPAALPQVPPRDHGVGNALHAQALWDAAMGHAVAAALDEHPGALVVHYVGSFHVEGGTGIPERIRDYRPRTRILVVFLQPVEDIQAWDGEKHGGLGDFVILTRKAPDAP
jgi:uncharacterized iron-regulated protein